MDSWKLSQRHKIPNCDYIHQNSIWKCFVRSYNELCKKITILSISFILWSITPPYLGVLRRVFARSEAEGGKPAFCVINQPMSKTIGKLCKITKSARKNLKIPNFFFHKSIYYIPKPNVIFHNFPFIFGHRLINYTKCYDVVSILGTIEYLKNTYNLP